MREWGAREGKEGRKGTWDLVKQVASVDSQSSLQLGNSGRQKRMGLRGVTVKEDGVFIHQPRSVTGAGEAAAKGHEFPGISTLPCHSEGAPAPRGSTRAQGRCLWLAPGWYMWQLESLRRHGDG